MSPTLFIFYLADMPWPTEPVEWICYADDITIWASRVKLPELEHKINDYLTEMSCFLHDNSLLIYAPKSTVTLFTPDPKQANTHTKIKISDAVLPLVRNTKLLGVYLDTFFSFNTHCIQVTNRVSKRNNVLKALAYTNWGQQKEMLLLTYKALGRSIAKYTAPVWSTNAIYNECWMVSGRSFINKTNNTGTKTETWCTPLFTSFHTDDSLLITTFCLLSCRNSLIQLNVSPDIA